MCGVHEGYKGRNTPHRKKAKTQDGGDQDPIDTGNGSMGKQKSKVQKVSMDRFYTYTKGGTRRVGVDALPTHVVRRRLKDEGRSDR